MEQRMPLAQLLLVQAIKKAHVDGERLVLTAKEQKILNGMPPQFEKVKQFLRQHVRK